MKLVGCVILYNPDSSVVSNIRTYIDYLEKLYVVDNKNGKAVFDELCKTYDNIELISYAENMGIAKPLNDVLFKAEDKYTHLLTMDQDSYFKENAIKKYIQIVQEIIDWNDILGVAPEYRNVRKPNVETKENLWTETVSVITSANIINIHNAIHIGGFDEKLFIDEVDNDFCYRGWLYNFRTLQTVFVHLEHVIGAPKNNKLPAFIKQPMRHNYIRTYYIMRNRIYVVCKDWKIVKKVFLRRYIVNTGWIVFCKFFLEEDKLRKIRSIFEGVKDAIKGNMGTKEFKY